MNTFATLATGIFDSEFGGETGIATVSQISGWLSANIGQLNTRLHANFTGEASDMNEAAGSIYSLMYLESYNSRQARNALRGVISNQGGNVLSIGDNDNRITFANKNEVAKTFRGEAIDLATKIDKLVYDYTLYGASPRCVVGFDATISGSGFY